MMKAVRMLRKAHSLSPDDGEIREALGEAEREYNAVLKEQEREKAAAQREAREAQQQWNQPEAPRTDKRPPPASLRTPPPPSVPVQPASSDDGGRSSHGFRDGSGGGSGDSSSNNGSTAASDPSAASASAASQPAASRAVALAGFLLSMLLAVVRVGAAVGERTGVSSAAARFARLPSDAWRHIGTWASRKWDNAFDVEPDSRERLAYLLYYWRARLRWPIRLVGILLLLMLAWRYPWWAYAVVVVTVSCGATYAAPYLPKFGELASPRPVVASIGAVVCLICWLLPHTTAWLVGLSLWGLIGYLSWQFCAALSALLLLFYAMPTLAMGLVAAAAWLLFLVILPPACLFLTEMCIGCYFMPFHWPFLHAVLLCLLFANFHWKPMLPFSVLLIFLYYFPRIVLTLLGLFVLFMAMPLLNELRTQILKLLANPYGNGETKMPEKIKDGEQAAEVAVSGKTHYEVLHAHRGASPAELKACYKRMALLLHPDKNPHESAAAAFKRVGDAFAVLSDPCQRAEYDANVDGGGDGTGEEEAAADDGPLRPPENMPAGPPGLKKRKARPPGRR